MALTVVQATRLDSGDLELTFSDNSVALVKATTAVTAAQALLPHRTAIAVADGTTKPLASDSKWQANPGGATKCRVFVTSTGSPTGCTLRAYVRSGGVTGQVLSLSTVTLNGTPNYDAGFDVQADGDDVLVLIETLSGGTSPTITILLSWR